MAMSKGEFDPITAFEDWYKSISVSTRDDRYSNFELSKAAHHVVHEFEKFRTEHLKRVANYHKYETMADAEVVTIRADLPNVSSGDIAGMVRRTARMVVQHTPNVEIISEFDDDKEKGILAQHLLKANIIGDDLNSNEMQQNLFTSTINAFTLGFDAVIPVLNQHADKTWHMDYDQIYYTDVFPEPGVKNVQKASIVYVRRYLTRGDVAKLLRNNVVGWDERALQTLCSSQPPSRQRESIGHEERKHHTIPEGYEIITYYNSFGDPFLTFDARSGMLLRIEKNKDPLKRHPVQFLILERDAQQPLGKSQIALVFGRQEFQDLFLNGAMKLWYKNINPTILGYGTGLQAIPNMSPGKYVPITNPNAKIEAFETNTMTLQQFSNIASQNQGAMINLVGAADQQMAATAGNGMSATPQGVEAQEAMVDITTNNYQKAVENFFSRYCSYALTVYFQEMKGAPKIKPSADTRRALTGAGMPTEAFDIDGALHISMDDMATIYSVRCVSGSLVELEDEKQLRILNQLFVPLSQAMPALAATQDPDIIQRAAAAMQFIIDKEIRLSGSAHQDQLSETFLRGQTQDVEDSVSKIDNLEAGINDLNEVSVSALEQQSAAISQLQQQMSMLTQSQQLILDKLGVQQGTSAAPAPTDDELI